MLRLYVLFCVVFNTYGYETGGHNDDIVRRLERLESKQQKTEAEVVRLDKLAMEQRDLISVLEERITYGVRKKLKSRREIADLKHTVKRLISSVLTENYVFGNQRIVESTEVKYHETVDLFGNLEINNMEDANSTASDTEGVVLQNKDKIQAAGLKTLDTSSNRITASRRHDMPRNLRLNKEDDSDHSPSRRRTITSCRRQVEGGIGFTAYLDHPITMHDTQTIKFNKIITNDGGAYNNHTGVFTCPEAGVYYLFFALGAFGSSEADATLVINSVRTIESVTNGGSGVHETQGSNSLIARLNQGDVVWVDGNRGVYSTNNWRLTTFTGFYLYP